MAKRDVYVQDSAMALSKYVLGLIAASVCLSSAAQLLLRSGMSSAQVQRALEGASVIEKLSVIGTTGPVLLGLLLYGCGALLWLLVLARVPVSVAYPFVGLGFLVTMTLGVLLLGETLTVPRAVGTLMVSAGIYLIARP